MDALNIASQVLHFIGWGALLAGTWKASRFFTQLEIRAKKLEDSIETVKTNHLPHLQLSLDCVSRHLERLVEILEHKFHMSIR